MPYKDIEKQRAYQRKANKKWRDKNPEEVKKQWAKYQEANKDKLRTRSRIDSAQRREEEPDKVKEESKRCYHKTKHKHKTKVAAYGREWHYNNKDRRNTAAKVRHKAFKEKVIEYLGGCCAACGLVDDWSVFDSHHLDPSKKSFGIMGPGSRGMSWEEIKVELDKCVLLCANCHRKQRVGLIFFDISTGHDILESEEFKNAPTGKVIS